MSADLFAGQPGDPDLLAELYDLEHDEVVEDHAFYREITRRIGGPVLDLGCGSGRLLASFLRGGARRILGIDGTPALIRRAEQRVASTPELADAAAEERLSLAVGDARHLERTRVRKHLGALPHLVVLAGVLPHLDGPEEGLALLSGIGRVLAPDGVAVLDDIGPGQLPTRDLPLSLDWRRTTGDREVVRRSQLDVRDTPEGLRVLFSTIVDVGQPGGTIARLPASYRLWYPSDDALTALAGEAGLTVSQAYGSHDLDSPAADSERRIFLLRRAVG